MGLYTTIRGEEIKYSGLFARAAAASGIVVKSAAVQFTKDDVLRILVDVHRKLSSGLNLGEEYGTAFSFENLASDTHRLALLYRWATYSDQQAILTFA